jgi:hypothetical protein
MKKFPAVPDELLKALEEAFPDKAPRKATTTQTEMGILIGQQIVMDFIRRHHTKQNILEG